jgi:uncharacterized protein YbaP (TraB family)
MLIGTIHVGDQTMYPLPRPLLDFLKHSDGLVVEADLSADKDIRLPLTNLAAEQVLDSPQRQKLAQIAKQLSMDSDALMQSAPWKVAMTLQIAQVQQLGYSAELGIDQYLIRQAKLFNRTVIPLETLQHQIDILSNFKQDGAELLTTTLDTWDEANQTLPCLFESWIAGDFQTFSGIAQGTEMSDEVSKKLKTGRNEKWVEKLTNDNVFANQSGRYVIAVGALHLVGEHNLLKLLEERGFTIERLNQSQLIQCIRN